jgi:hypothetical protein
MATINKEVATGRKMNQRDRFTAAPGQLLHGLGGAQGRSHQGSCD